MNNQCVLPLCSFPWTNKNLFPKDWQSQRLTFNEWQRISKSKYRYLKEWVRAHIMHKLLDRVTNPHFKLLITPKSKETRFIKESEFLLSPPHHLFLTCHSFLTQLLSQFTPLSFATSSAQLYLTFTISAYLHPHPLSHSGPLHSILCLPSYINDTGARTWVSQQAYTYIWARISLQFNFTLRWPSWFSTLCPQVSM